jgi:hypothetical protein
LINYPVSGKVKTGRNYFIFSDDDFLDEIASTEFDEFRVIKGTCNFTTRDKRKSLDPIEISVFNRHDSGISKKLFRPVVNQLTIDKAVDAVSLDLFHFGFHFVLNVSKASSVETFSARSSSASLPVASTRTLAPKTLTLSVSMGVFATRILAFSSLFG